jgi:hypothetical protein
LRVWNDDDAGEADVARGRRDRWKAWILAIFSIGPLAFAAVALVSVGVARWGVFIGELFGG